MQPPIYVPKGAAKEYGDLALNIYTGCNHDCFYCFAPSVLHKTREDFRKVEPRKDIVNEVRKQLEKEQITGKLIHLCFTCDPYPADIDTTPTREIIKLLKAYGNHVQILTKSGSTTGACRDLNLLDSKDRFGVTYCGYPTERIRATSEPGAAPPRTRIDALMYARIHGIKTWISFEPILDAEDALYVLRNVVHLSTDVKIGKLNYHPSSINWHDFGHAAEAICIVRGLNYYIKDGLRADMRNGYAQIRD